MVMKKIMMAMIAMSAISIIMSETKSGMGKILEIKFFSFMEGPMNEMLINLILTQTSEMYMIMVSLVTLLVALYSETYMDQYNNKKFSMLLTMFFMSMIWLTASNSMMNVMLGWEMLGITSLMLIMFYPTKTSAMNSFMTMLYNRMGDVLMILSMAMMIMENSQMMNTLMKSEAQNSILALLIVCSMTKSAQFPLSAWLPAAMSAPTPISAMVHSSTLVTAGIFIWMKLDESIMLNSEKVITMIMISIFMSTFLMAGLMALTEKDMKKIIAFSTMSQISMIMIFITSSNKMLAFNHMFCHAIFKTLLFCTAGMLFLKTFSNQSKKIQKNKLTESMTNPLMMLSIFSMTGMIVSLSFFTKHSVMESMMNEENYKNLVIIFLGSLMTINYSLKLMSSNYNNDNSKSKLSIEKKTSMMILMASSTALMMTLETPWLNKLMTMPPMNINKMEMMLISTAMIIMILKKTKEKKSPIKEKKMMYMSENSYKNFSKQAISPFSKEIMISEYYILKNYFLKKEIKKINLNQTTLNVTMIILILMKMN